MAYLHKCSFSYVASNTNKISTRDEPGDFKFSKPFKNSRLRAKKGPEHNPLRSSHKSSFPKSEKWREKGSKGNLLRAWHHAHVVNRHPQRAACAGASSAVVLHSPMDTLDGDVRFIVGQGLQE